ncbi:MBL fold metallo-hydrolase [Sedimentibacter sp. zth1]|uniref:MBL fold metallo-hydrolase n=1 Tax=Sedimentibacter sp. zth1 TaxID=2816908 RepID=UPI001A90ECA2|nr:MBL fold metallo-hydrolase [Sedimentibacter sp. zth1]QSX05680.1 MBL fold metallo-hydrolase [Sedimentibacter sp. zth1]
MENWFTVENIDKDTFAISEYKHWEETHCYLLLGKTKALLIDTGLGVSNIREVVEHITSLPIEVATTHIHWDHIGGHKYFKNILVYEAEQEWLSVKFPIPLAVVKANLSSKPCDFPSEFNIENYQIYQGEPSAVLHDGDTIDLGNRQVQVIHTPGHSPGHICFYEKERQYLYSGDLIYAGCLDAFYPTTNPVEFMKSVKKVKVLPVQKILPAHHKLNVPVNLINEIDSAFIEIFSAGKLTQGNGIFEFTDFQIHI